MIIELAKHFFCYTTKKELISLLNNLILLLLSYLLGSIPFGLLIGLYIYHQDIRQVGSGNIGTTNAFRAYGPFGGTFVFLLDMLKGGLPVLLASTCSTLITWHPLVFGLASVIGHIFPIFLKFKGGKAVATSFGLGLFYSPIISLLGISAFFVCLFLSKLVSLSSMVGVFTAMILSYTISDDWFLRIIITALLLLVIYRHKLNIQRIIRGTERKINFRKKK